VSFKPYSASSFFFDMGTLLLGGRGGVGEAPPSFRLRMGREGHKGRNLPSGLISNDVVQPRLAIATGNDAPSELVIAEEVVRAYVNLHIEPSHDDVAAPIHETDRAFDARTDRG